MLINFNEYCMTFYVYWPKLIYFKWNSLKRKFQGKSQIVQILLILYVNFGSGKVWRFEDSEDLFVKLFMQHEFTKD